MLVISPDALKAFLGLHGIAESGSLDPQTRERIALVIAQSNSCEYCVSAHTAMGRKAGLTGAEIEANRAGTSQDAKAAAAVAFAQALNSHLGEVTAAAKPPRSATFTNTWRDWKRSILLFRISEYSIQHYGHSNIGRSE